VTAEPEIKSEALRVALDAFAENVDRANTLTRAFRVELEQARPELLAGFDETIAAWRASREALTDAAQMLVMPLVRANQELIEDG
jgi:hypothetical protein